MSTESVSQAAALLRGAAADCVPCGPVRNILGSRTDLGLAYAVQQVNTDLAIAAGRRVTGRKVGLTSLAVQKQLGVDQPDYGTLFVDMCIADGVDIEFGSLIAPRAEAEVAVVLEHDLDKGEHNIIDIINAIAYVIPAIEIVDSRIKDWDLSLVDTVADNASSGLYVVGTQPKSLRKLDLRSIEMQLHRNGVVESTGVGSACLGNPLHAALAVANVMSKQGTPLRAGECIMTGALGPVVPVVAGDHLHADMGELGSVSTRFAAAEHRTVR
jgi:2-keto-4-pentenoate hydratase